MNRKAVGKFTLLPLCLLVMGIARPVAAQTCSTTACLVSAVDAANLDTSTKKHVISLAEGYTYNLSGPLTVSGKLTISGNDSKITGTGLPYIFLVSGGRLTLNEVTLTNATGTGIFNDGATVTLNSTTIRDCANPSAFGGGGIFNNGGTVTLNGSNVRNNTVGATAGGGGILNNGGIVTLNSTAVTGNNAGAGGGVANYAGTLMINSSIISGNAGTQAGGGIYNNSGDITLNQSTITNNTSALGGGIYNLGGTVTIDRKSNVTSNSVGNIVP